MREIKTICLMCPVGCELTVSENGVFGNRCKKGEEYGRQEFFEPKRVVTTLIRLSDGRVVPAKTAGLIKKELIFPALSECAKTVANPPVKIGDVLIKNIAGSGIDLVATNNVQNVQS